MTKQKYVYNKYVSLDDYLKTLGYDVQFGLVHSGVTNQYKILYNIFGNLYDCPWCEIRMQPLSVGLTEWGSESSCPHCKNPIKFDCYGIISGQWDILAVTKGLHIEKKSLQRYLESRGDINE